MTSARSRQPLAWLGSLAALYLLVPLGAFAIRLASSSHPGFSAPGLFPSLYISAATATISSALVAFFGVPLAYVLAGSRGAVARITNVVVQLPLAVPPLMSGILLVYVVGPYTPLGRLFGGHLTETMVGIVLAQCFVAAPFLVVAARSAFRAVDPSLYDKARTLGKRDFACFWQVAVPVAREGIRAGLVLSWLRAFGEYGATVVLSYHPYSLPVFTYLQFSGSGLSNTEAPTALALVSAGTVVLLGQVARRREAQAPDPVPGAVVPSRSTPSLLSFDLALSLGGFRLDLSHRATRPTLGIVGASGAGKSATLRCVAGLFGAAAGDVVWNGRNWSDVAVERRPVGYVPQGTALFPHLGVWEQLVFGSGCDPGLAAYWLERLGLSGLERRYPSELSGGQRQRVAIAQALGRSPELVLLDEPSSGLDVPVRDELRAELRRLQRETGLSSVLVTHDPEEAAMLCEEVLVIDAGRLLQSGLRAEVFGTPASLAVARLLGVANVFEAVARPGGLDARGTLVTGGGDFAPGAAVLWSIAPEHVEITPRGRYEARVLEVVELGTSSQAALDIGLARALRVRLAAGAAPAPGSRCRVELPPDAVRAWEVAARPAVE